jgi:hypothetical protein
MTSADLAALEIAIRSGVNVNTDGNIRERRGWIVNGKTN